MAQALPPPDLNIPSSNNTVSVSIIDSTSRVGGIPVEYFMQPTIPGYKTVSAPSYSFLIKRVNPANPSKYDTLLFDLGVRKDWEEGSNPIYKRVKEGGFTIDVQKNVIDILEENGEDVSKVGGIIWSHHHFDHTGDPSTFPPNTDLIVGPGFKSSFVPAYPTRPEIEIDEDAWEGRTLREIDFDSEGNGLRIGGLKAMDFFGDGSFYLLDTPGHAIGHVCGLARTRANPPEFITMGGDIAHHSGEFRPTEYLPLPKEISPRPWDKPFAKPTSICPGHLFEAIHPERSSTRPFMHPEGDVHDNAQTAVESLVKWSDFDAQDNVFAVFAHDDSLSDILEYYPAEANDWSKKAWKTEGRWRFLRDFEVDRSEHP